MEKFLNGDLDVVTLLFLFITGLLTKRFVPWWVHEEVLEKLKAYEDAAPELITDVRRLIELIDEDDEGDLVIRQKGEKMTATIHTYPRSIPPRQRDDHEEVARLEERLARLRKARGLDDDE